MLYVGTLVNLYPAGGTRYYSSKFVIKSVNYIRILKILGENSQKS